MLEQIRALFQKRSSQRTRRFFITIDSLSVYGSLPNSAQSLLLKMLKKIRSDCDINALIIQGDYRDFGYPQRQNFYRDRSKLVDAGFLIYEKDAHFVNPCMLEYHNKKQRLYLINHFRTSNSFTPNFGGHNK